MPRLESLDNLAGTILDGDIVLESLLGKGGMGLAYRGRQAGLNRSVCVKFMAPELVSDDRFVARFMREGQILARLQNPNVVHVYSLGTYNYVHPYMVMELIEGDSLRQLLTAKHVLPWRHTCELIIQTCHGLDAVHKEGFVHRDLKPDNILILNADSKDQVKLIDFGLAGRDQRSTITETGMVIGSVHYMAPESFIAASCEPQTDIYAIGCILFECLTGAPPFTAESMHALAHKHANNEVPLLPASCAPPTVVPVLQAMINRACAKGLGDRFADCKEMASCLLKLLQLEASGEATNFTTVLGRVTLPSTRNSKRLRYTPLLIASVVTAMAITGVVTMQFNTNKGNNLTLNEKEKSHSKPSHRNITLSPNAMVETINRDVINEPVPEKREENLKSLMPQLRDCFRSSAFNIHHLPPLLTAAGMCPAETRVRMLDFFSKQLAAANPNAVALIDTVDIDRAMASLMVGDADTAASILKRIRNDIPQMDLNQLTLAHFKLACAILSYDLGDYRSAEKPLQESSKYLLAASSHEKPAYIYAWRAALAARLGKQNESQENYNKAMGDRHPENERVHIDDPLANAYGRAFWECLASRAVLNGKPNVAVNSLWMEYHYFPPARPRIHRRILELLGMKDSGDSAKKIDHDFQATPQPPSVPWAREYLSLHLRPQGYANTDPWQLWEAADLAADQKEFSQAVQAAEKLNAPYVVLSGMYINRVIRFLDHCEWSNALAHIPQTRKFLAPERQVDLDAMEVTCRMASGQRESTSRLTAVLKEFDLLKRWQWDQVTVSSLAVAAITCGDDNAFDHMFKKMKDAKIDTAGMLKEALVIAHEFIDAERTQDASNSLRVLKRVPATELPRMQPGFDELRFLLSPMSNNDIPNALKIAEERLTVNPKRTECLATRVLAATTDSDLRCKAFGLLGQAIAQRSDSRPTDIDKVEEALRYCQENDNGDSNVQLLLSLAKVKEKRSDYAAMERYVIQARELAKRTSARSQLDCTILLARCFSLQNKFAATMATEDELHKLIAANNRSYLTKTMVDIVEVNHKYALRLPPKEALSLYQQNLRFIESNTDSSNPEDKYTQLARNKQMCASILLSQHKTAEAGRELQQAAELYKKLEFKHASAILAQADVSLLLARCYLEENSKSQAVQTIAESASRLTEAQEYRRAADLLLAFADSQLFNGDSTGAFESIRRADALHALHVPDAGLQAQLYFMHGRCLDQQKHWEESIKYLKLYKNACAKAKIEEQSSNIALTIGDVETRRACSYRQKKDYKNAESAFMRALQEYVESGSKPHMSGGYFHLADTRFSQHDTLNAIKYQTTAVDIIKQEYKQRPTAQTRATMLASVARLGIYLEEAGRKTEALACFGFVFEKCGPLSEQENYIRNFAWQYLELLYKAGREEDRVRFEQTLANHRESAQTYLRMAEERLTEADAAATYRFLDVCQQLAKKFTQKSVLGNCHLTRARALISEHRQAESKQFLELAKDLLAPGSSQYRLALVLEGDIACYEAAADGSSPGAQAAIERGIRLFSEAGAYGHLGRAYIQLANLEYSQSHRTEAIERAGKGIEILRSQPSRESPSEQAKYLVDVYAHQASWLLADDKAMEAAAMMRTAIQMCEKTHDGARLRELAVDYIKILSAANLTSELEEARKRFPTNSPAGVNTEH